MYVPEAPTTEISHRLKLEANGTFELVKFQVQDDGNLATWPSPGWANRLIGRWRLECDSELILIPTEETDDNPAAPMGKEEMRFDVVAVSLPGIRLHLAPGGWWKRMN